MVCCLIETIKSGSYIVVAYRKSKSSTWIISIGYVLTISLTSFWSHSGGVSRAEKEREAKSGKILPHKSFFSGAVYFAQYATQMHPLRKKTLYVLIQKNQSGLNKYP